MASIQSYIFTRDFVFRGVAFDNQSVRQIKQLLHRVTNHKIQLRCEFQGTAFQLLDVLRHMHPMLRTSVWLVTHDGREKMIWLTMRRM